MINIEHDPRAVALRQARLTPVTSHPLSMGLLLACPPDRVHLAFEAADAAVEAGRLPGEVLTNLLLYLSDHPMPTDEDEWAVLVASL